MEVMRPFQKFDILATFTKNADISITYGECLATPTSAGVARAPLNGARGARGASPPRKLFSWRVSNCSGLRMRIADALVEHFKAQAHRLGLFGSCHRRRCVGDESACAKANYKFYLAFENNFCDDYLTEKTYSILINGTTTVPVIFSGAPLLQLLPPHSYIDVTGFSDPAALAEYLEYLDGNDTAYAEYFAWRTTWTCRNAYSGCRICSFFGRNATGSGDRRHNRCISDYESLPWALGADSETISVPRNIRQPKQMVSLVKVARFHSR